MICQACGLDKKRSNFWQTKVTSFLVGVTRLELATPRPPVWCATTCATPRLLLFFCLKGSRRLTCSPLVEVTRFELATPTSRTWCSTKLSHTSMYSALHRLMRAVFLVLLLCFCKLLCEGHNLEAVCISLNLVGKNIIGLNKCPHICNNKAQAQCQ